MGRVPIWKIPDLTHEIGIWTHKILLRKERKCRKFMGIGEEDGGGMGLVTISDEGEHVQLYGFEENKKMNFSGYGNCWAVFYNQVDKWGCREDE
jgi:hypothetical protein